jgi:hypothetical protein
MRREEQVACMRNIKTAYKTSTGKSQARKQLGDPEVDKIIILKWMFKEWN